MRSFDWKSLAGSCALLAAFVLALPGVKAVRADPGGMPLASNDGPTCSQPAPDARLAQSGAELDLIRQQIAAQFGPGASEQIVVLNNRGYNYGPASSPERAAIDLERMRAEP